LNKAVRLFFVFTILLTTCSCRTDELDFNIRFDEIEGLKAGHGVLFKGNTVGEVDNVVYTEAGDFLVKVAIQSSFASAATRDSHFYIVDDPQTEGEKAIEIIQEKAGGEELRSGETVNGSVRPTIFNDLLTRLQKKVSRYQDQFDIDVEKLKESIRQDAQEMERGLENTLDELSDEFSQFAEEVQKVPDSEELKQLEAALDRLAAEIRNSQRDIREKIQNELVPEIQKRLNILREKLEKYNRQNEIDPLDRQLKEIQTI